MQFRNENTLLGAAIGGAVTGCVGSFFAPVHAAAAGGMFNVMGACALGTVLGCVVSLAVGFGTLAVVGFGLKLCGMPEAAALLVGTALGVVAGVAMFICSPAIGAALLGISASATLYCAAVGVLAEIGIGVALSILGLSVMGIGAASDALANPGAPGL